jgi:hypothetical protein
MEQHKGDVRTIWIRSPDTYDGVVHSTWPFPGDVTDACTNIQQVA